MALKLYTSGERNVPKKARSRMLRERTDKYVSVAASSSSVPSSSSVSSHTHDNLAVLNSLAIALGYLLSDGNKVSAGYADESGIASDLTEDSPVNDRFVFKHKDDVVSGALTMEKMLTLLDGIKGNESWQIDAAGNARLLSLLIGQMYGIDGDGVGRLRELLTDSVKGSSYTGEDLLTDKGFRLWTDDKGNGRITVDYLNVRKKFTAMMLEIMKTQYSGGNIVMGCAGSVLSKVEGYDSDGKRVLLPSEYDYTNKDEEIDMWAADRASAYAWMPMLSGWMRAAARCRSFLTMRITATAALCFLRKSTAVSATAAIALRSGARHFGSVRRATYILRWA